MSQFCLASPSDVGVACAVFSLAKLLWTAAAAIISMSSTLDVGAVGSTPVVSVDAPIRGAC